MSITNDITIPADPVLTVNEFEKLYIDLRKKEHRLYTDGQVSQLPLIAPSHIHYAEWQVRRRSTARLINYLENKNKPLSILEAGCGNGWLSGRLAEIRDSTVTGADINKIELNQAKRVFGNKTNIFFTDGDLQDPGFGRKFDAVVFAASIQYFPFLEKVIKRALTLLNEAGEIHIVDSYLYKPDEVEDARLRTYSYYNSAGYGEMSSFYFHHTIDALSRFNYKILFSPFSLKNRLFRKKDLFPWICIKA